MFIGLIQSLIPSPIQKQKNNRLTFGDLYYAFTKGALNQGVLCLWRINTNTKVGTH